MWAWSKDKKSGEQAAESAEKLAELTLVADQKSS